MPKMRRADVPTFVAELLEAGAQTWAFTEDKYFLGDADAPKSMRPKIWAICDRYGDRDHLRSEIATHLISIGRRSPYMFDA